jgi:hypothetical protein
MSVGSNNRLHGEVVGPQQTFATASHSTSMTAATKDRYGTMAAGKVGSGRRSKLWSTSKSKSVGAVQGSKVGDALGSPSSLNKSKSLGSVSKSRSITSVLGRTLSKSKRIGGVRGTSLNKAKSVSNVQQEPSTSKLNSSGNTLGARPLNKARSIGNVQSQNQAQDYNSTCTCMSGAVDNRLGVSLNLSKSISNVPAHSFKKSKTMGSVGRTNHKLSVDSHLPPNFGRVTSAGVCRQRERERRFSTSPRPLGGFLSLHPSPLFLSQASLGSQTSQSSITSQVLDTAESLGITVSLRYLVEDAKKLHKKLLALSLDLDLEKIGISDEVDSVCGEGVEEGLSHQAWREKSFSPFECVCMNVCMCVCVLLASSPGLLS